MWVWHEGHILLEPVSSCKRFNSLFGGLLRPVSVFCQFSTSTSFVSQKLSFGSHFLLDEQFYKSLFQTVSYTHTNIKLSIIHHELLCHYTLSSLVGHVLGSSQRCFLFCLQEQQSVSTDSTLHRRSKTQRFHDKRLTFFFFYFYYFTVSSPTMYTTISCKTIVWGPRQRGAAINWKTQLLLGVSATLNVGMRKTLWSDIAVAMWRGTHQLLKQLLSVNSAPEATQPTLDSWSTPLQEPWHARVSSVPFIISKSNRCFPRFFEIDRSDALSLTPTSLSSQQNWLMVDAEDSGQLISAPSSRTTVCPTSVVRFLQPLQPVEVLEESFLASLERTWYMSRTRGLLVWRT